MKIFKNLENTHFKIIFKHSIPVLLGYLPLGAAFGIMLVKLGYHFSIATLMSVFIYAGSGQYLAITFFANNAGIPEIAIATLLLNSRHAFFGLSLLKKYNAIPLKIRSYLIFALTDETYALVTSKEIPKDCPPKYYYFILSLLNQIYWILGSTIGAVGAHFLKFNSQGMGFTLTALFVVLTIEQYYAKRLHTPFILALVVGLVCLVIIPPAQFLLVSIFSSVVLLLVFRRFLK